MKNQLLFGAIASSVITLGFGMFAQDASAVQLYSSSLTTNNYGDPSGAFVDSQYDIDMVLSGNNVTFSFLKTVSDASKVSTIYFGTDNDPGFFDVFNSNPTIAQNGLSSPYTFVTGNNLGSQIGNNAGWGVTAKGDPGNGNNALLKDAGDSISFTFGLTSAYANYTEAQLANLFLTNPKTLGIAFHLQAIVCPTSETSCIAGESEWYQANPDSDPDPDPVPTPAAVLPILGGLFGAASRRKKGESTEV